MNLEKTKTYKKKKFENSILEKVNYIIKFRLGDQRFKFVSITRVELSADLSHANIFWDTFDNAIRGDVKKAMSGVSKKVRALLSENLKVRHTPELHFFYDSQYESERYIEDLIKP